jgi:hypothetical protein
MRKYQAIWERVKKTGKCRVTAPPPIAARIRKAVGKEKYNDTIFKVEWEIKVSKGLVSRVEAPELKTVYDRISNTIEFILVMPVSLEDL